MSPTAVTVTKLSSRCKFTLSKKAPTNPPQRDNGNQRIKGHVIGVKSGKKTAKKRIPSPVPTTAFAKNPSHDFFLL